MRCSSFVVFLEVDGVRKWYLKDVVRVARSLALSSHIKAR
jgi:hypothetical protein